MARFINRASAARDLAEKLLKFKDNQNTTVVGLARGGMVTASVIADKLNLALGFLIVKKIGVPGNPELAVGAVTDDGDVYIDNAMKISMDINDNFIRNEIDKKKQEAILRAGEYQKHYKNPEITGKIVILTDDGIATGATMAAAIASLIKRKAAKIVIAVPCGSSGNFDKIRKEVDEVVSVSEDPGLNSVSEYYDEFPEVDDDEVIKILKDAKNTNT